MNFIGIRYGTGVIQIPVILAEELPAIMYATIKDTQSGRYIACLPAVPANHSSRDFRKAEVIPSQKGAAISLSSLCSEAHIPTGNVACVKIAYPFEWSGVESVIEFWDKKVLDRIPVPQLDQRSLWLGV